MFDRRPLARQKRGRWCASLRPADFWGRVILSREGQRVSADPSRRHTSSFGVTGRRSTRIPSHSKVRRGTQELDAPVRGGGNLTFLELYHNWAQMTGMHRAALKPTAPVWGTTGLPSDSEVKCELSAMFNRVLCPVLNSFWVSLPVSYEMIGSWAGGECFA